MVYLPHGMSRREFLRLAGLALGAGAVSGCSGLFGPDEEAEGLGPDRPPLRVIVIGAGMAGLVAAYELARVGHDVAVVEARERVGGRVLTIRAPFVGGQFAEAGAARIPPNHDLTLGYASTFGLATDPFYPASGTYVDYGTNGRTFVPPGTFLESRPPYVKIRGGSERLPLAFAAALGERVVLSSPVAAVDQRGPEVVVTGEGGWTRTADRLLCTSPLPVLDRIQFQPALSVGKQEAAAGGFAYMPSTRVFVQVNQRFWEGEGLNGWAVTNWPEELWHPTWDLEGPPGILLSYVRGDRALAIDALDPSARVPAVLEHWEGVFPGVTQHAGASAVHSWQEDPWSGRAWASPSGSELAFYGAAIREPEGRIYFAGEHTSDDRGWMQGALASGLRAASEIHQS